MDEGNEYPLVGPNLKMGRPPEDGQEQDVVFNDDDEPEVGNTETDTEVEDNGMTADALYRKLSEFST